jgi:hypothetical protein
MRRFLYVVPALALALSSCDKTEVKPFTPTQAEKDSAIRVVSNTAALQALKTDAGSGDAISKFTSINSDAQSLIANQQQRNSGKSSSVLGLLSTALEKADSLGACVTQAGGTITYNHCATSNGSIDGTIAIAGDTITTDLSLTASGSGTSVDVTYKGSVAVTATTLAGDLTFKYAVSGVTYTVDVNYDALVVDASQCLVGGSLTIDASYKIAGVSISTGSTSATVQFDFGPVCGDLAAAGG